ncbi:MAG: LCP family protein [Oscillospiraceae bacterium]|nr:LCP family protein [Oscillospiraceae bacterium]
MENERKVQANGRSGKKAALAVVCVLAVLVLGAAGCVGIYLNNMLNSINHVEVAAPVYTEPAETVAVEEVQLAAAAEEKPAYAEKNATNYLVVCKPVKDDGVMKTDTMILCSLNTATKTITMTALDAEAEVDVPAYKNYAGGEADLNTVYGLGSTNGGTAGAMELMNQTLYDNFGIEVDHNLEINMKLFAKVVGRLGSVEIELSEEEAAYLSEAAKKEIKAGVQEMDSALAQQYVNMWGDEDAEGISAISGQRKIVEAIVKEVRSEYVANLQSIVFDCLPMITTSMSQDKLEDTLWMLLPMLRNLSIENGGTVPAA